MKLILLKQYIYIYVHGVHHMALGHNPEPLSQGTRSSILFMFGVQPRSPAAMIHGQI